MQAPERVVLLVDDVEQVTAIAADYLERRVRGLKVVAFHKPLDALAWLRTTPHVDLVLTDNHMAELDGLTLLAQARDLRPHATRVLMTAYLDLATTPHDLAQRGVHALIRKPWEWSEFETFLRELLALPPDERARVEREGPLCHPANAFAQLAAVPAAPNTSPADPTGAAGATRAVHPTKPAGAPGATVATSPAVAANAMSPASSASPAGAPAAPNAPPPAGAPRTLGSPPPPGRPVPLRQDSFTDVLTACCPRCRTEFPVDLPAEGSAASDEEEARRILALLQARPGIGHRIRTLQQRAGPPPGASKAK